MRKLGFKFQEKVDEFCDFLSDYKYCFIVAVVGGYFIYEILKN